MMSNTYEFCFKKIKNKPNMNQPKFSLSFNNFRMTNNENTLWERKVTVLVDNLAECRNAFISGHSNARQDNKIWSG